MTNILSLDDGSILSTNLSHREWLELQIEMQDVLLGVIQKSTKKDVLKILDPYFNDIYLIHEIYNFSLPEFIPYHHFRIVIYYSGAAFHNHPLLFLIGNNFNSAVHTLLQSLNFTDLVDINHTDRFGNTALILTSKKGQDKVAAKLLKCSNINVNHKNHLDETALSLAIVNGNDTIVNLILNKQHINVNATTKHGCETPLILAVQNENFKIVELLLKHSNINVNFNTGFLGIENALLLACQKGASKIVESLLKHKDIHVNCVSASSETPLILGKNLTFQKHFSNNSTKTFSSQILKFFNTCKIFYFQPVFIQPLSFHSTPHFFFFE